MIARIDADGVLHIEAETDLERYALRKWCCENVVWSQSLEKHDLDSRRIMINHGWPSTDE